VAFGRRPLADHEPDGEASAQLRVGHEDLAPGVHAIQEFLVQGVELRFGAAVVHPKTDEAQVDRGEDFEIRMRFEPFLEQPGQPDMLPDHGPDALDAVGTEDKPQLEGAEPAPELNSPVPVVADLGIHAGFQVFGVDLERPDERARILDEIGRTVEIGQHPLMRVEDEGIRLFDAVQDPAFLGADGSRSGISGIDMEP